MNWIGWVATAIFSSSYIFRRPVALRWIQALAAFLWIAYGLAIGAPPVVVANVIVAGAAVYSSLRISRFEKRSRRLSQASNASARSQAAGGADLGEMYEQTSRSKGVATPLTERP